MNFFKHLFTIIKHRRLVRQGCFRVGLIKQGLTHDLSKFSPIEFWTGVKYFQGTRSPNVAERNEKGYSEAWMHHKGRNRHHYEYWTDYDILTKHHLSPVEMPRKYLIEMFMDRIAACKVYKGKQYKDSDPLTYFMQRDTADYMHVNTYRDIKFLLEMLSEKGEEATFYYIRNTLL